MSSYVVPASFGYLLGEALGGSSVAVDALRELDKLAAAAVRFDGPEVRFLVEAGYGSIVVRVAQ